MLHQIASIYPAATDERTRRRLVPFSHLGYQLSYVVIVRLAEPTDLKAVLEFDAFPGERINEIMEKRMLVTEIDGQARAYISWQKSGCVGKDYINRLVVSRSHRRLGVAKHLVTLLNTVLSGRVFISTHSGNLAGVRLLETTGWHRAGQISGSLPDNEVEVFFYQDLLPPTSR